MCVWAVAPCAYPCWQRLVAEGGGGEETSAGPTCGPAAHYTYADLGRRACAARCPCSIKHMPDRQIVRSAALTALSTTLASSSRMSAQVQTASALLKETVHKLAVNFMSQSVHPGDAAHCQAVEYNLAVFRRQLRQFVTEDTNFW